ncbi:MAG: hypothetical protein AABM32_00985 [Chloroflexota bacterium]
MKRYVVSVIVVATLAFTSAAWAAKPDAVRIEIDEIIPGAIDCGSYQLDEHVFGHIILRTFFRKGEFVMSLNNIALKHTISNPTGESLTTPDVGADHLMIAKDGSATLAIIGIVVRVVVPGQGLVAGEVGKVTLFFTDPADTEPDVSFAGIHDGFDAVDAAFCAALAP